MNAAEYAASLRRERSRGAVACLGGLAVGLFTWLKLGAWGFAATYSLLLLAVLMLLYGLLAVRTKPANLHLVFDRDVPRAAADAAANNQRTGGLTLSEWGALDELGALDESRTGSRSHEFSRFVSPKLGHGVAQHDAILGIASCDAVLADLTADATSAADESLTEHLHRLRARLGEAREANARFCFIPVAAWSGQVVVSLSLYLA